MQLRCCFLMHAAGAFHAATSLIHWRLAVRTWPNKPDFIRWIKCTTSKLSGALADQPSRYDAQFSDTHLEVDSTAVCAEPPAVEHFVVLHSKLAIR